jgi:hypothetical protein
MIDLQQDIFSVKTRPYPAIVRHGDLQIAYKRDGDRLETGRNVQESGLNVTDETIKYPE